MSSPRLNSVEEYLASQDPAKERTLRSVIDLILTQFPDLESKISWNGCLPRRLIRALCGAPSSTLDA